MSKREHAIALRDLALTVVRAHGSSQTVGHKLRLLTCRLDDVRIALQMPLQQQPSDIPPVPKYLAAHRGKPTPVYLPYVMDVWDGGKVLSGRLLLVDFWPDPAHSEAAALMSGEFLLISGEGQTYSEQEADEWLKLTKWRKLERKPL